MPLFFFFNDTATTEIYTLSLHDALPICLGRHIGPSVGYDPLAPAANGSRHRLVPEFFAAPSEYPGGSFDAVVMLATLEDRKSTRLNSSHGYISYAVFCLKKKTNITGSHY